MASVGPNARGNRLVVRAYGGMNPQTGKPRIVSETLAADASEDEIAASMARVDARAAVTKGDPAAMTVETATAYDLECCEADGMSATTISSYRSYRRRHVVPRIGRLPLDRIDTMAFGRFFRDLRAPKDAGGAGLSASTAKKIQAYLHGCFTRLVRGGLIKASPMGDADTAAGARPEASALSPADFAKLRRHLEQILAARFSDAEGFERHTLACIWWTALHTGLRRGELSGLQVQHRARNRSRGAGEAEWGLRVARVLVEVRSRGELIAKEPKSKASARWVSTDARTDAVLDAHMRAQRAVLAEQGIATEPDTPLFAHADGSPWRPAQLTVAFRTLAGEIGLAQGAHLHTLRHTHATYLIQQGEDIVTVQRRLGHSSSRTTMDIYGHLLPGADGRAARAFAGISEEMGRASADTGDYVPVCPKDGKPCARYACGAEGRR